jgi:hypothetical protein
MHKVCQLFYRYDIFELHIKFSNVKETKLEVTFKDELILY